MNFSERSYRKELLDDPSIPFSDIRQNMKELNFINTWLGGHAITIHGLKKLAQGRLSLHVCEIGCGGGDNLYAISGWAEKNGITIRMTGVDINSNCIRVAEERLNGKQMTFHCCSYEDTKFTEQPDIIFSSLFCHHFTDPELVFMMSWMKKNAGLGFFINDLHRHPAAYYSIALLTRIFSRSRLVRNDAPLSVLRGFARKDWTKIFSDAGIASYKIKWKWAFRWLVSANNT